MALAFKALVDDLVSQYLIASLGEPIALVQTDALLARLETHEALAHAPVLVHEIASLRAILSVCRQEPTLEEEQQILSALEQVSQLLHAHASAASTQTENGETTELQLPSEVDAQLLADFLSNARLAVDDLEREIDSMRHGDPESAAAVKRRIHTLKGETGMLGLVEMERVLHAAETFLEQPHSIWNRVDSLLQMHDWVSDALTAYGSMRHPAKSATIVLSLFAKQSESQAPTTSSSASTLPDATDSTSSRPPVPSSRERIPVSLDVGARSGEPLDDSHSITKGDPTTAAPPTSESFTPNLTSPEGESYPWSKDEEELVVEFLHEVEEHLANVDQVLLDTEQTGIDADRVNRLFRAFHTMKGVASFLHLQQFQDLTHATETMLDRFRSGEPIPLRLAIDSVFESTTLLRELGSSVQECLATRCGLRQHAGVPALVNRLRSVTATKALQPDASAASTNASTKFDQIPLDQGSVDPAAIEQALNRQQSTDRKLGEELIAEGAVPSKTIARGLRTQQASSETASKLREIVKVDLERVDHLVEAIGELVIVESMVSNAPETRELPTHVRNYLSQFAKLTRELQELGMCMRMVPVRNEFQKMMRIVRDLARRSDKQVRMELSGENAEIDRILVEQIADPLVHLIRNAVDHGIESVDERRAAGKPDTGTIRLTACHEGGKVIIEISDDGRGINRERVVAKALALGLIDRNATLSDSQVFDLLFAPGFSTAQRVTEISGRGVGMDVVKRNIEGVRGRIITSSTPGRGTTFRLVLPLTLAIIDGMVVRCGDERFILPTLNIVESLQPTANMLFSISGVHEHILVRGQTLPLVRLNRLLEVSGGEADPTKALIIIVESLRTQIALLVDEVVMKQQVVIKTLGKELDASNLFAGAAILSNGRVGLIINIESLIDASRDPQHRAPELHPHDVNRARPHASTSAAPTEAPI